MGTNSVGCALHRILAAKAFTLPAIQRTKHRVNTLLATYRTRQPISMTRTKMIWMTTSPCMMIWTFEFDS